MAMLSSSKQLSQFLFWWVLKNSEDCILLWIAYRKVDIKWLFQRVGVLLRIWAYLKMSLSEINSEYNLIQENKQANYI